MPCGPRFTLRHADFQNGTCRLHRPGVYTLVEDIVFDPVRTPCAEDGLAHSRGWLAAITIECDDVFLDLNGHSLAQSVAHALLQRFFTLICVGNHMFRDAQSGPFPMGPALPRPPRNVTICNGLLGLTSHFCIYAPATDGLLVCDLLCRDWEVSAISVNECRGVVLRRVRIERNRAAISLSANFSHLQHAVADMRTLISATHPDEPTLRFASEESASAHDLLEQLEHVESIVASNTARRRPACAGLDPEWRAVLEETSPAINGSMYGLAFNGTASMIHALVSEDDVRPTPSLAHVPDLELTDVNVHDVVSEAVDVLAFEDASGRAVMAASGQAPSLNLAASRCCKLTPLLLAQLLLMKFQIGRAYCPEALLKWCLSGDRREGALPLSDLLAEGGCRLLEDRDAMLHEHKGAAGLLCRNLHRVNIKRLHISDVTQKSRDGRRACQAHVTRSSATALLLAGVSELWLDDIKLQRVQSAYGRASAIAVLGACHDIVCRNMRCRELDSFVEMPSRAAERPRAVLADERAQLPRTYPADRPKARTV